MTRSSSIQACSGDIAYCGPRSEKQPVLPSDIVHYWCANKSCSIIPLGRVSAVSRDFSNFAVTPGDITLQIYSLRCVNEQDLSWQSVFIFDTLRFPIQSKELVCIEDEFHYIFEEDNVSIELKVYLDNFFDDLSAIDP